MDASFTRPLTAYVNLQTLALLVLGFVLVTFVQRRYFSSISDIPGPFSASFSVFWQIRHIIKGHTEEETIALHGEHGPFVRISHQEVSVANPDAIRTLLAAPLRKGDWYQVFNLPDRRYVNQMGELDPKRHIHKARNLASGYAFSNVIKSEPFIDDAVRVLESQLDDLSKERKPVHFNHWFNFFGFDVLGEVTFSQRFGFLDEGRDVGGAIANTRFLAIYIGVIGHLYFLHDWLLANPLIGWLNLQPSNHIFDTALRAVEARSSNPDKRKDMMEQWLDTRRKFPDRMEEKELLAGAVVNVGAGADTISAAMQSFFYFLIRNPKYMQKLRSEIDAAQGRGQLSNVVSFAESQGLEYLQACIKETYRMHPPVAMGLPRVVPKEGVTIGDRTFEEGIILSINPWVIHRDTTIFGADADAYNPERWLDVERARNMDKYMLTFGAGYNQCPGKHLAHLEVSKVAATLIRDFDIEQIDPKQDWRFETHFTAVPYGWPCRVRRRDVSV